MTILIVDDSELQRRLLGRLLHQAGYPETLEAASAEDAFTCLANASEDGIELVLLDVNMPGMDGIEACRRIRADPRWPTVPVIIVTAEDEAETIEAAFAAGATDYVHKPVNRIELAARLRAALALKAESDRRRAGERQIAEIGAMIQQRLLAGQPPTDLYGVSVATLARPSRSLDGDFYEFFRHGGHCFDLVIADVMGKGLPAALLGAAVKNRFFKALHRLFACRRQSGPPSPERIVTQVHEEMTGELVRLDAFVTLCYARFDLAALTLEFVDAGHPKPLLYRDADHRTRPLAGDSVPLGFDPAAGYQARRCYLMPGDLILFYSDGLTEARNPAGDLFGTRRLTQYLGQAAQRPVGEVLEAIGHRLALFTRNEPLHDDLTCIAVRIEETAARSAHLTLTSEMCQLAAGRAFINGFCQPSGEAPIEESTRWQLALGLNEALANIVRHAYASEPGRPIHIQAMATADRVRLELTHQGRTWRPTATPLPRTEQWKEDGYGLFIIENYIDEVIYTANGDGTNTIVLEKRLEPEVPVPPPASGD